MKKLGLYQYTFRFYLLFLFLFVLGRLLFLFDYFSQIKKEAFPHILQCFRHGFLLDLSACAGVFFLPLLFIIFGLLFKENKAPKYLRYLTLIIVTLVSLLQATDLVLYQEWQTKVNYKAISYLVHPSEVLRTSSAGNTALVLLLTLFQLGIVYWFFKKSFFAVQVLENKGFANRFLYVILAIGLSFLALRGGWQPISINISDSYYSNNQVLNDAGVNSIWNLTQSISENMFLLKEKPLQFYTTEDAKMIVDSLYEYDTTSSMSILKNSRPNIVLVILESWNAEVMASFNGKDSVSPYLDQLVAGGLSFQKCYSPGLRSDLGIPAILSGFPCDPYSSIASQPAKYKSLASWPQQLKDQGYYTSFLFGGQLVYGNIKSYVYWNQFDNIQEGKDLSESYKRGRLGVHDEDLYRQGIANMNTYKEPFFSVMYTLSSHPPYDIPVPYRLQGGGRENAYINSVNYADQCIQQFMTEAKKQAWYKNTLFVFVADHGHGTPHYQEFYSKEMHHIPVVLYGDVLRDSIKGMKISKVCSQTDLVKTVLNQMNINTNKFRFSKDVLNKNSPGFAPYIFYLGYGWVNDSTNFEYEIRYRAFEDNSFDTIRNQKMYRQGKAYVQHVFDTYNKF